MVLLHIACIKNNPYSGVCVAVPQHVRSQMQHATVGFINVNNENIAGLEEQIPYQADFCLCNLPRPFNNPDLVVFHEAYRIPYLKISKSLKKENIPYIIIPHGELTQEAQKKKWLKKKVANLLFFNRFIKGAKALQCLSVRERNTTHFSPMKFVEPNGMNIPNEKKEFFSKGKTKFLYIGRLDAYHKGLDLLIEAVGVVADDWRKNDNRLEIYGPDYKGYLAHLKTLIEKNQVGDLIALHKEISGDEKKKVLLGADVFVQTSRFEGMPMGILEALSYGIPCLVTEGTTLRRLIEEKNAGWGVDTCVQSIAEGLKAVINSRQEWKQKGENAREFVENNFAWDHVSDIAIRKYEKLVRSDNH